MNINELLGCPTRAGLKTAGTHRHIAILPAEVNLHTQERQLGSETRACQEVVQSNVFSWATILTNAIELEATLPSLKT
jgi:hypothetical protein